MQKKQKMERDVDVKECLQKKQKMERDIDGKEYNQNLDRAVGRKGC